tara:strand:- start:1741 stop:3495 length:1755 start_codon:yes stop_codon:yes gene_type:complete
MNLITFNIDDKLLDNKHQSIVTTKKNLLFSHAYQINKYFQKKNKYKIALPFDLDKNKNQLKKLKLIDKTYKILMEDLCKILNKAHNKNFDQKYWEILIGKWLKTFVYQMFTNWEILAKIEKKYKIKSFSKIALDDNIFIPENTSHSHSLIRTVNYKYNLFHHWTITKMIEHKNRIKINSLELKQGLNIKKKISKLNKPIKYESMYHKSFDKKIFYYRWDVPRKIKIEIMKYFKFLNLRIREENLEELSSKYFDRNLIFKNKYKYKNFNSFLNNIIKFTFPKIFLEKYSILEEKYKKLNWPKNPKYILTTFPYYDEVFKFYCAQNYTLGSKTIITQHGQDNIYQYDDWFVNKIFKYQLSWGGNKKKGLKNFIFTKNYQDQKAKFKFKKDNKILLILYSFSETEDRMPDGYLDNYSINKIIYSNTIEYLKNLKKNLLIKNDIKALQLTRFPILKNSIKKKYKNIKFMGLEKPFNKVIFDYNLSIHFFIGTPFFESIYLNRPTIVIFDPRVNLRFDKKFKSFLKKFRENQLCFDNPNDAAKFINKNYDNLNEWWNLPKRQKILDEFCNFFCRRSEVLQEEFDYINKI